MIDEAYMAQVQARIGDIETELASPEVVSDQTRYRELLTEHAHLKDLAAHAETFLRLTRDKRENQELINDENGDEELKELARAELEEIEQALPKAEKRMQRALLPPDPDDQRNVIMEIRAGTGGDEAALFAGDLYRMYSRHAEQRGWKVGPMDVSQTNLGGYKEIVFSVEGENVYQALRYESGGHRVQRIPATEAGGRIHTSAATVAVFPEADEAGDVDVKMEDLRIDTYRASGAGGQHVNKTDSAVRITHEPTGLVVQSQDERSQHRNKEKAMRVLRARLLDLQRQEEESKAATTRRNLIGSGDRSQRIRTYNFPQNRVTDHRINLTLYSLDRMMEGELTPLLDALCESDTDMRLKEELATRAG
jgi:peptide chain release factor 1